MFDASASTHIGLVRKGNEDSFAANKKLGLWVIADGVGGNVHGEYASQLIVKTVERKVAQGKGLVAAIQQAHEAVKQAAIDHPEYEGMASTVVACHFKANHYDISWVGDSRAYLVDKDGFHQLTRDHNRAQWLIEQGEITRDESWNHPTQCQLTHAIGFDEGLHIDHLEGHIYGHEMLLLCTDGLTGQLRDSRLFEIYNQCKDEVGKGHLLLERLTESLIQHALDTGGNDNITLAIIRLSEQSKNKYPKREKRILESGNVHEEGVQAATTETNSDFLDEEGEETPTSFQKNMNQLVWLSVGIGAGLLVVLIAILWK